MNKYEIKPVPGYPALAVSNTGEPFKVCSGGLKRLKSSTGKWNPYPVIFVNDDGNGNKKTIQVHKLVALAFLGERPVEENGQPYVVDHIDADRTNNNVSNLEYVTSKENTRRSMERRGIVSSNRPQPPREYQRNAHYKWWSNLPREEKARYV